MLRQLLVMTGSDLRQRIRDKSVFIFALIVPLSLMFVMNLVFGDTDEMELNPVTVAASASDEDLDSALIEALGSVSAFEVTVEEAAADDVRVMVDEGDADMGVIVPPDFTDSVTNGTGAELDVVQGDSADLEASILMSVLDSVTDQMVAATEAAAAGGALGIEPAQLGQIAEQVSTAESTISTIEGETSSEQLDAGSSIVAGQTGLFLLFTVGFGVLALMDERQQGTLSRLESMPMQRQLIPVAKALVSYVLGVVATLVLLTVGGLMFDVSFGPFLPIFILVLCLVAAGTSVMFIIVRVAKNAEQAGVSQTILAMVLGMAGGAFFPISADGVAGVILDLNPVAAFTRALGINQSGGEFADLGIPIFIMLGFAVVSLVIARLIPNRGVAA